MYILPLIAATFACVSWIFLIHQRDVARVNVAKRLLLFGLRASGQGRHRYLSAWQDAMGFIGFKVKLYASNGSLTARGRDADLAARWILYVQEHGDLDDFDESVAAIDQMLKDWRAITKE